MLQETGWLLRLQYSGDSQTFEHNISIFVIKTPIQTLCSHYLSQHQLLQIKCGTTLTLLLVLGLIKIIHINLTLADKVIPGVELIIHLLAVELQVTASHYLLTFHVGAFSQLYLQLYLNVR